jgi:multidrug efflux system membrane fusion protein
MNMDAAPDSPKEKNLKSRKTGITATAFILLGLGVSLWVGLSFWTQDVGRPQNPAKQEKVPVVIGTATQKTVPVQLHAIGNVEGYASVAIKARVDGELTGVHFQEGQEVKKGDLLFTIDPRPYEVALKEAKAQLEKDTILAQKAEKDLLRYQALVDSGTISQEQYDQVYSNAKALKASVEVDNARIEQAKLALNYCFIRSPITGRTGNLEVDQGNQIEANDDQAMVQILQIEPVYVSFAVPEKNLAAIKRYMATERLEVEVSLPQEERLVEKGFLSFLDNEVDKKTGTIRLKATFTNKNGQLWPGQFVDVALTVATMPDAVVVPSQAIQTGQQGQYAFVVKPDLTVEARPLVVKMTLNDEAVVEGLVDGERVVTEGQLRLVPGAHVEITNPPEGKEKDKT